MPKKPNGELDPRHAAFIVFAYDEYQKHRSTRLVIDGSDVLALKRMLTSTIDLPEYDMEHLKWMWLTFMNSKDRFEIEQGKPLRFFCSNINKFAVRLNGNGNGNGRKSAGTEAARTWVQQRLQRKAD